MNCRKSSDSGILPTTTAAITKPLATWRPMMSYT